MKKLLPLLLALTLGLTLTACGDQKKVFRVGMECAYAPYNWTQVDNSNGAVPISNVSGTFANGYDVQIAKKIADANGWKLEIVSTAWDSLTPSLQSGTIDAAIAGQSMTADRMKEVDMAGPYYYANIVLVTKKGTPYADAKSISEMPAGKGTAQSGTIWYDTCLPQVSNIQIQTAAETAPAMIMALQTGTVDYVCTDLPTAKGAVKANPDMVILDFSGTDGDFKFADETERAENVNIGISVKKGNQELLDGMNKVLSGMKAEDFVKMMDDAIAVVPAI